MSKFVFGLLCICEVFEPIIIIIGFMIAIVVLVVGIPLVLVVRFWRAIRKWFKHRKRRAWAIRELSVMAESVKIVAIVKRWTGEDNYTRKFDRRLERIGMIAGKLPLKRFMIKD